MYKCKSEIQADTDKENIHRFLGEGAKEIL